ncbi:hypothetical protein [Rubrimonas cliftonensis]|uniref:Uncharacterized protein n=1 Tax=Rubrimonas cliftonensis TaxID=89524 RepID=A0A1H4EDJ5_9RHOB|nr:hypothetical protein [Rubrimonas cliftonensis]SEA82869.1 hypothetical protein SAMN05444370_11351 [Rubrimonas cliftonensis]
MIQGAVAIVIVAGVAFSVSAAPLIDPAFLIGAASSQMLAGLSGLGALCGLAHLSRRER